jgi:hypothetical protein
MELYDFAYGVLKFPVRYESPVLFTRRQEIQSPVCDHLRNRRYPCMYKRKIYAGTVLMRHIICTTPQLLQISYGFV